MNKTSIGCFARARKDLCIHWNLPDGSFFSIAAEASIFGCCACASGSANTRARVGRRRAKFIGGKENAPLWPGPSRAVEPAFDLARQRAALRQEIVRCVERERGPDETETHGARVRKRFAVNPNPEHQLHARGEVLKQAKGGEPNPPRGKSEEQQWDCRD